MFLLVCLWISVYFAVSRFAQHISSKQRIWQLYALDEHDTGVGSILKSAVRACVNEKSAEARYHRLLSDCGLRVGAAEYVLAKRILLSIWVLSTIWLWGERFSVGTALGDGNAILMLCAWCLTAAGLWGDRIWLGWIAERRRDRQMLDFIAASGQLLYFRDASMHVHAKLAKCLPVLTSFRKEWKQLLNDWYGDAGAAIERFKRRLGTTEAESFAETLNAIRLRDDPDFYKLLEERMEDQKEKRRLREDMRRESRSYMLFVLAGAPLLYTFRLFLHPWIQEGRTLLELLNS